MVFALLFRLTTVRGRRARTARQRAWRVVRPGLELLEDRTLLSGASPGLASSPMVLDPNFAADRREFAHAITRALNHMGINATPQAVANNLPEELGVLEASNPSRAEAIPLRDPSLAVIFVLAQDQLTPNRPPSLGRHEPSGRAHALLGKLPVAATELVGDGGTQPETALVAATFAQPVAPGTVIYAILSEEGEPSLEGDPVEPRVDGALRDFDFFPRFEGDTDAPAGPSGQLPVGNLDPLLTMVVPDLLDGEAMPVPPPPAQDEAPTLPTVVGPGALRVDGGLVALAAGVWAWGMPALSGEEEPRDPADPKRPRGADAW